MQGSSDQFTLRYEEDHVTKSKPEEVCAIDLIVKLRNGTLFSNPPTSSLSLKPDLSEENEESEESELSALLDELAIEDELPHLEQTPKLEYLVNEHEKLAEHLKSKGYSSNTPEYAHFFLSMLNKTITPLNQVLNTLHNQDKSKSQTVTRSKTLAWLKDESAVRQNVGIIAEKPTLIFEQTEISDTIAKKYINALLKEKEVMELIFQDILEKRKKDLVEGYASSKTIKRIVLNFNRLIASKYPCLINYKITHINHDAIINIYQYFYENREFIFQGEIPTDLQELFDQEKKYYNIIQENNGNPRCITFLPCEITYHTGQQVIMTFVAMSGVTSRFNMDHTLCQIHHKMKEFSQNLLFPSESLAIQFRYIEHASINFDWLLHETNRALTAQNNPLNSCAQELPKKPSQPCAEKKIFSELVKQLGTKSESGIANIKVLGETNFMFPYSKFWFSPLTSIPTPNETLDNTDSSKLEAMKNQEVIRLQKLNAKLKNDINKISSALKMMVQFKNDGFYAHLFRDSSNLILCEKLIEELDKFSTDNPRLSEKTNRDLKLISKKIFSVLSEYFSLKFSADISFTDIMKNIFSNKYSLLGEELTPLQNIVRIFNPCHLRKLTICANSKSAKTKSSIDLPKKSENIVNQNKEKFYFKSEFNLATGEAGEFYYPFYYRDACEQCQKQKMSYLTVIIHGADVKFDTVQEPISAEMRILNEATMRTFTPSFSFATLSTPSTKTHEDKQNILKLSDPRTNIGCVA